ncbi:CRISPR-associated protein [Clostridium botulinum]|nr:CRISPR-associated protein [Clostridium botulinum]NFP29047.1 CRISPR-associated protein [Clostridium botulinum]
MSNINRIKQYLINVKNISPLRIGNGEHEGTGVLLYDNHAVINGTTLSGLFREFFKKDKNSKEYELVFPKSDDNNKKNISKIYFYDSISKEEIKAKDLSSRNHIRIDERLGSTVENHLFNEYHIIEGKTFKLFFEVRGLDLDEKVYKTLCTYLERFITNIAKGKISIGSKSTFGFGQFKCLEEGNKEESKLYFKEYDLSKEEELDSYLDFNMKSLKLKDFKYTIVDNQNCEEDNIRLSLQAYCDEGFIIKGQQAIDSDGKVFDKSYEELINKEDMYIIPSSTIKGLVRNYCNKIYKTLYKDKDYIDNIFGIKANEKKEVKGKKGTIIFNDCKIYKNKTQIYNRIKIDKFTGGTKTGSLFKEELVTILKDNPINFTVSIDKRDKKAIALLILTFRDIGLGYITLGSGNNVGYGRFKGLSITLDGGEYKNVKIEFQNNNLIGDVEKIDHIISTLKE